MARVYVSCQHYRPHTHALTGFELDVEFDGALAQVSMLDIPEISEQEHERGTRAIILRLGQAIVQAAQDPQGIVAHPPPRQ